MQSLEDRLAKIREGGKKSIPEESLALMHRATQELLGSGLHERAKGEGDTAPDFALPNSEGHTVSLGALVERGPTVLAFFRGYW